MLALAHTGIDARPHERGDENVAWHLAHVENCGCREMPKSIRDELRRRGIDPQGLDSNDGGIPTR